METVSLRQKQHVLKDPNVIIKHLTLYMVSVDS